MAKEDSQLTYTLSLNLDSNNLINGINKTSKEFQDSISNMINKSLKGIANNSDKYGDEVKKGIVENVRNALNEANRELSKDKSKHKHFLSNILGVTDAKEAQEAISKLSESIAVQTLNQHKRLEALAASHEQRQERIRREAGIKRAKDLQAIADQEATMLKKADEAAINLYGKKYQELNRLEQASIVRSRDNINSLNKQLHSEISKGLNNATKLYDRYHSKIESGQDKASEAMAAGETEIAAKITKNIEEQKKQLAVIESQKQAYESLADSIENIDYSAPYDSFKQLFSANRQLIEINHELESSVKSVKKAYDGVQESAKPTVASRNAKQSLRQIKTNLGAGVAPDAPGSHERVMGDKRARAAAILGMNPSDLKEVNKMIDEVESKRNKLLSMEIDETGTTAEITKQRNEIASLNTEIKSATSVIDKFIASQERAQKQSESTDVTFSRQDKRIQTLINGYNKAADEIDAFIAKGGALNDALKKNELESRSSFLRERASLVTNELSKDLFSSSSKRELALLSEETESSGYLAASNSMLKKQKAFEAQAGSIQKLIDSLETLELKMEAGDAKVESSRLKQQQLISSYDEMISLTRQLQNMGAPVPDPARINRVEDQIVDLMQAFEDLNHVMEQKPSKDQYASDLEYAKNLEAFNQRRIAQLEKISILQSTVNTSISNQNKEIKESMSTKDSALALENAITSQQNKIKKFNTELEQMHSKITEYIVRNKMFITDDVFNALDAKLKEINNQMRLNSSLVSALPKEMSVDKRRQSVLGLESANNQLLGSSRISLDQATTSIRDQRTQTTLIQEQQKAARELFRSISDGARQALFSITALFVAMEEGIRRPLAAFAEFESTVNKFAAVTVDSGFNFEKAIIGADAFAEKAQQISLVSRQSAKDIAEAGVEMGRLGFSADETVQSLEKIVIAAEATGEKITDVATVVLGIKNAFDLSIQDVGKITNLVSAGVIKSAADLKDLATSFKYIGPIAKGAGQSLESVMATLTAAGNQMIVGSTAGTSYRQSLIRLSAQSKETQMALEAMGVKVFDGAGKFREFKDVVIDLANGLKFASDGQRTNILESIFGDRAVSFVSALINEVEKGKKEFNELYDSFENVDGLTEKMREVSFRGLGAEIEKTKATVQALGISLGQALAPSAIFALNVVRDLAGGINNLSDSTKSMLGNIGIAGVALSGLAAIIAAGTFAFSQFGLAATSMAAALSKMATVGVQINSVSTAIQALNVALGINTAAFGAAATAAKGFMLSLLTIPVLGAIVAITAAIVLLARQWKQMDMLQKEREDAAKQEIQTNIQRASTLQKYNNALRDEAALAKLSGKEQLALAHARQQATNNLKGQITALERLQQLESHTNSENRALQGALKDIESGKNEQDILVSYGSDITKTAKALKELGLTASEIFKTSGGGGISLLMDESTIDQYLDSIKQRMVKFQEETSKIRNEGAAKNARESFVSDLDRLGKAYLDKRSQYETAATEIQKQNLSKLLKEAGDAYDKKIVDAMRSGVFTQEEANALLKDKENLYQMMLADQKKLNELSNQESEAQRTILKDLQRRLDLRKEELDLAKTLIDLETEQKNLGIQDTTGMPAELKALIDSLLGRKGITENPAIALDRANDAQSKALLETTNKPVNFKVETPKLTVEAKQTILDESLPSGATSPVRPYSPFNNSSIGRLLQPFTDIFGITSPEKFGVQTNGPITSSTHDKDYRHAEVSRVGHGNTPIDKAINLISGLLMGNRPTSGIDFGKNIGTIFEHEEISSGYISKTGSASALTNMMAPIDPRRPSVTGVATGYQKLTPGQNTQVTPGAAGQLTKEANDQAVASRDEAVKKKLAGDYKGARASLNEYKAAKEFTEDVSRQLLPMIESSPLSKDMKAEIKSMFSGKQVSDEQFKRIQSAIIAAANHAAMEKAAEDKSAKTEADREKLAEQYKADILADLPGQNADLSLEAGIASTLSSFRNMQSQRAGMAAGNSDTAGSTQAERLRDEIALQEKFNYLLADALKLEAELTAERAKLKDAMEARDSGQLTTKEAKEDNQAKINQYAATINTLEAKAKSMGGQLAKAFQDERLALLKANEERMIRQREFIQGIQDDALSTQAKLASLTSGTFDDLNVKQEKERLDLQRAQEQQRRNTEFYSDKMFPDLTGKMRKGKDIIDESQKAARNALTQVQAQERREAVANEAYKQESNLIQIEEEKLRRQSDSSSKRIQLLDLEKKKVEANYKRDLTLANDNAQEKIKLARKRDADLADLEIKIFQASTTLISNERDYAIQSSNDFTAVVLNNIQKIENKLKETELSSAFSSLFAGVSETQSGRNNFGLDLGELYKQFSSEVLPKEITNESLDSISNSFTDSLSESVMLSASLSENLELVKKNTNDYQRDLEAAEAKLGSMSDGADKDTMMAHVLTLRQNYINSLKKETELEAQLSEETKKRIAYIEAITFLGDKEKRNLIFLQQVMDKVARAMDSISSYSSVIGNFLGNIGSESGQQFMGGIGSIMGNATKLGTSLPAALTGNPAAIMGAVEGGLGLLGDGVNIAKAWFPSDNQINEHRTSFQAKILSADAEIIKARLDQMKNSGLIDELTYQKGLESSAKLERDAAELNRIKDLQAKVKELGSGVASEYGQILGSNLMSEKFFKDIGRPELYDANREQKFIESGFNANPIGLIESANDAFAFMAKGGRRGAHRSTQDVIAAVLEYVAADEAAKSKSSSDDMSFQANQILDSVRNLSLDKAVYSGAASQFAREGNFDQEAAARNKVAEITFAQANAQAKANFVKEGGKLDSFGNAIASDTQAYTNYLVEANDAATNLFESFRNIASSAQQAKNSLANMVGDNKLRELAAKDASQFLMADEKAISDAAKARRDTELEMMTVDPSSPQYKELQNRLHIIELEKNRILRENLNTRQEYETSVADDLENLRAKNSRDEIAVAKASAQQQINEIRNQYRQELLTYGDSLAAFQRMQEKKKEVFLNTQETIMNALIEQRNYDRETSNIVARNSGNSITEIDTAFSTGVADLEDNYTRDLALAEGNSAKKAAVEKRYAALRVQLEIERFEQISDLRKQELEEAIDLQVALAEATRNPMAIFRADYESEIKSLLLEAKIIEQQFADNEVRKNKLLAINAAKRQAIEAQYLKKAGDATIARYEQLAEARTEIFEQDTRADRLRIEQNDRLISSLQIKIDRIKLEIDKIDQKLQEDTMKFNRQDRVLFGQRLSGIDLDASIMDALEFISNPTLNESKDAGPQAIIDAIKSRTDYMLSQAELQKNMEILSGSGESTLFGLAASGNYSEDELSLKRDDLVNKEYTDSAIEAYLVRYKAAQQALILMNAEHEKEKQRLVDEGKNANEIRVVEKRQMQEKMEINQLLGESYTAYQDLVRSQMEYSAKIEKLMLETSTWEYSKTILDKKEENLGLEESISELRQAWESDMDLINIKIADVKTQTNAWGFALNDVRINFIGLVASVDEEYVALKAQLESPVVLDIEVPALNKLQQLKTNADLLKQSLIEVAAALGSLNLDPVQGGTGVSNPRMYLPESTKGFTQSQASEYSIGRGFQGGGRTMKYDSAKQLWYWSAPEQTSWDTSGYNGNWSGGGGYSYTDPSTGNNYTNPYDTYANNNSGSSSNKPASTNSSGQNLTYNSYTGQYYYYAQGRMPMITPSDRTGGGGDYIPAMLRNDEVVAPMPQFKSLVQRLVYEQSLGQFGGSSGGTLVKNYDIKIGTVIGEIDLEGTIKKAINKSNSEDGYYNAVYTVNNN